MTPALSVQAGSVVAADLYLRELCISLGCARNFEFGPSPASRGRVTTSPCQGEAIYLEIVERFAAVEPNSDGSGAPARSGLLALVRETPPPAPSPTEPTVTCIAL